MTRNKLDTYNRVPRLESEILPRLLVASYIALFFSGLAGLVSALILPEPWPPALPLSAAAVLVSALIHNYDSHRTKRCRFCGSPLDSIVRPLLLTAKYLSLEGRKRDNYFYTQKRDSRYSHTHWVKLSNQSLACHHCRLTEERHQIIEEIPSVEELEELASAKTPEARSNFER